jgi:hypothetical protein
MSATAQFAVDLLRRNARKQSSELLQGRKATERHLFVSVGQLAGACGRSDRLRGLPDLGVGARRQNLGTLTKRAKLGANRITSSRSSSALSYFPIDRKTI